MKYIPTFHSAIINFIAAFTEPYQRSPSSVWRIQTALTSFSSGPYTKNLQ